jgi:hypothetical protein
MCPLGATPSQSKDRKHENTFRHEIVKMPCPQRTLTAPPTFAAFREMKNFRHFPRAENISAETSTFLPRAVPWQFRHMLQTAALQLLVLPSTSPPPHTLRQCGLYSLSSR